jgi:hypothetical protein
VTAVAGAPPREVACIAAGAPSISPTSPSPPTPPWAPARQPSARDAGWSLAHVCIDEAERLVPPRIPRAAIKLALHSPPPPVGSGTWAGCER